MKTKLLLIFLLLNLGLVYGQEEIFSVKKLAPLAIERKQDNTGLENQIMLETTPMATSSSADNANIAETKGELSVSQTGGANYTVPIAVPPGINGVQPEIALTYNSQAGNGMAGYGWNISGISVITRLPQTTFHNSNITAIDLSQTDQFSLDGQRLMLKSGTYGASGSVYETENFSNVKIEAFSSYYNGPGYFKVSYPDGSYAYYGQTSNSKSRMDYAITYWQNAQGLRISYEYVSSNNSLSISKIKYGARTTSTPINEIQFVYKARTRPEQSYAGGLRFVRNTILSSIKVIGNGTEFRRYDVTQTANTLGFERLTKIQEKSGDGQESYAPINFNYSTTPQQINIAAANGNIGLNNVEQRNAIATPFDIDGKGIVDFSIHSKTASQRDKFWVIENARDNTGQLYPYEVSVGSFETLFPIVRANQNDIVLSGQALAVVQKSGTSDIKFRVIHKTLGSFYQHFSKTWSAPTYTNQYSCDLNSPQQRVPLEFLSGDFNGNGITDIIAISKPYSSSTCYQILPQPGQPCGLNPGLSSTNITATGKANATEVVQDSLASGTQLVSQQAISIDEGCCDCETYNHNSSSVYLVDMKMSSTSNFVKNAGMLNQYLRSTDNLMTADVNGDGKTDIIQVRKGAIYVYSLNQANNISLLFSYSHNDILLDKDFPMLLGDYNGDGKTDFMFPKADNSTLFTMFLGTGSTFTPISTTQPFKFRKSNSNGGTYYGYSLIPTDINGDGKTDIIDYNTTTYTNSTSGNQIISVYRNVAPTSTYADPKFVFYKSKSQSGYLKHYPIPIFLNSEQRNFNLEFCSISDGSITAFEFTQDNQEDMLLRGVSQNGVNYSINYADLLKNTYDPNYGTIYTSGYEQSYPYIDIDNAPNLKVVASLNRAGSGLTTIKRDFQYHGAVSHMTGLGFAGFQGFSATNWYATYSQRIFNVVQNDIQKRGAPILEYSTNTYANLSSAPSGYISKTSYTYSTPTIAANKVYKIYKTASATEDQLNGFTVNQSFSYDSYLNPTVITTNYSTGETERKEFTYANSTSSNYYIGRPTKQVLKTTIDGNLFTTEESYTYNSYGFITNTSTKANGSTPITSTYSPDSYGNILSETISPPGESSRTVSYEYDSGTHRFITKKTDHENLETIFEYNLYNGNLLSETDPFGFTTTYSYDSWNRPVSLLDYLGNTSTTSYTKSGYDYTVTTSMPDGSEEVSVYNKLQQLIEKRHKNGMGQWVKQKFEYDELDRVKRESEPYFNSPTQWNTTEYDNYGRIKKKTSFTGKTINITYSGATTTIDDGTKTETITKDAMGNVTQKSTSGTGTIAYTYFGNKNLKSTTFSGSTTTIQQDAWGRKTKIIDPSAGTFTYQYDGYGQVTNENNPKGQIAYTYDNAGRILTKTYSGSSSMAITYNYNSTTKLLTSIAMTGDSNNSTYSYAYDSYHRLLTENESTPFAQFETKYTYNSLNQVATEEYKATRSGKISTKKVKNTYQYGGLKNIRDNTTNSLLWELGALNERGQLLSATLGANMEEVSEYDSMGYLTALKTRKTQSGSPITLMNLGFDFNQQTGLLQSRSNSVFNWNESFSYDDLERLTGFIDNNGNNSQQYDAMGRISENSMIGDYGYTGSSFQQASLTFNTKGTAYYNNLDQQTISYNAFNKPIEINEYGKDRVSFQYNAFEGRSNMYYGGTQSNKNQRRYQKHYSSNGKMEVKFDSQSNKTTFVTYIGGDAYSAPLIFHEEKGSSTVSNYFYLHRDYLGSILSITDSNGNFKEKRHFDAWGKIVKLTDGNNNNLTSFNILDRGYTGHEHLLGVGIIHMNGRLYDAMLHRFLSPDNYVQDPSNPLNFNRYSYVLNNPLKYNDPSGEFIFAVLAAIAYGALIGAATAAAVYTISAIATNSWSWNGLGTSILYGAIGGAISGGPSIAATLASTSTSSFLQSSTMNMFSEIASQVGTSAVMGDKISVGSVIGSVAGGFVGAKIGNWSGTKGGWFKNAMGEIGFNTLKGGVRGAVTGGVGTAINGGNIGKSMLLGAKNGATGSLIQSSFMIGIFGATYKPSGNQLKYANKMAESFGLSTGDVAWRKGGLYQVLQPLWTDGYEREVTWGRNVATFSSTNPSTMAHEYGHIIQVNQQGWAAFQGRGIFEQLIYGANAYSFDLHPNSNEVGARIMARDLGGAPSY